MIKGQGLGLVGGDKEEPAAKEEGAKEMDSELVMAEFARAEEIFSANKADLKPEGGIFQAIVAYVSEQEINIRGEKKFNLKCIKALAGVGDAVA
jgi:hypothetical protein